MVFSQPFLTTQQTAALLNVAESTIRAWIGRGDLRAIRVGREYRIAGVDLEAFVVAHATRPPADADAPKQDPGRQTDSK